MDEWIDRQTASQTVGWIAERTNRSTDVDSGRFKRECMYTNHHIFYRPKNIILASPSKL